MKTYLDYLAQDNCINLGQLCVYNDYLEQNNKRDSLKKFGGNIFLFLSDLNIKDFLKENFCDFYLYFDINLIQKNIIKPNSTKTFNVYQLASL